MQNNLVGTGVALITPFETSGKIDFTSLEKILEHLITQGINYLVVMGTTGESVVLTKSEKKEVIAFIKEKTASRIPIVLGMGGNNTAEIIEQLETSDLSGISAILSVSPYYNKPTQEGIYQHYKAIAEKSPLPIILYNVPGRTGTNMSSATTLRLAHDFSNIVAIKEASGNLIQIMDIIKNKPNYFEVISGDDILTFPMIMLGAKGVISVVAQAYPRQFSDMVNYSLNGQVTQAARLHYELTDFTNLLFSDGSPGGIKAAMEMMGLCKNELRLPLVPVQSKTYELIREFIVQFQKA